MKILRILGTRKKYGDLYDQDVADALSREHNVEIFDPVPKSSLPKPLQVFKYLQNLENISHLQKNFDLVIRPMNHAFFINPKTPQIIIAYHHDTQVSSSLVRWHHQASFKSLVRSAHHVKRLVTIANFWKDYFQQKAPFQIEVIPCGFRLDQYSVSDSDVAEFLIKYQLQGKKIIYIGNPQKEKGAEIIYHCLKNTEFTLVSSGNGNIQLPILNLNLSFKEYLCLLKVAGLTITYSQFKEGWNRVAHESLLMGTPVIGSGYGGMGELLQFCQQMIEPEPNKLLAAVQQNFKNQEKAKIGLEKAKYFSIEEFNKKWLNLVSHL